MAVLREPGCRACQYRGILMPNGESVCLDHALDVEVELIEATDRRGRLLGLRRLKDPAVWHYLVDWPYGPNIDLGTRIKMCDWAEEGGFRFDNRRRGWTERRAHWQDHCTTWRDADGTSVLVCQPYGLSDGDLRDLLALSNDGCSVTIGDEGWYGFTTTFVTVKGCAA